MDSPAYWRAVELLGPDVVAEIVANRWDVLNSLRDPLETQDHYGYRAELHSRDAMVIAHRWLRALHLAIFSEMGAYNDD